MAWQPVTPAVTKFLAHPLFLLDFRGQAGAGPPPDPAANPFLGDDYHKYKQQQILETLHSWLLGSWQPGMEICSPFLTS